MPDGEVPWTLNPFSCNYDTPPFLHQSAFDKNLYDTLTSTLYVSNPSNSSYTETGRMTAIRLQADWYFTHRTRRSRILSSIRSIISIQSIIDEFINYWETNWQVAGDPNGFISSSFETDFNTHMNTFATRDRLFTAVKERMREYRESNSSLSQIAAPVGSNQYIRVNARADISVQAISPIASGTLSSLDNQIILMQQAQSTYLNLLNNVDCNESAIALLNTAFFAAADAVERLNQLKLGRIIMKNVIMRSNVTVDVKVTNAVEGINDSLASWPIQAKLTIQDVLAQAFPIPFKTIFDGVCENTGSSLQSSNQICSTFVNHVERTSNSIMCSNINQIIDAVLECDDSREIAAGLLSLSSPTDSTSGSPTFGGLQQVYDANGKATVLICGIGEVYLEDTELNSSVNIDLQIDNVIRVSSTIGEVIASKILESSRFCTPGYEQISYILASNCLPTTPSSILNSPAHSSQNTGTGSSGTPRSSGTGSSGTGSSTGRAPLSCPRTQSCKKCTVDIIMYSTITGVITCMIVLVIAILILKK